MLIIICMCHSLSVDPVHGKAKIESWDLIRNHYRSEEREWGRLGLTRLHFGFSCG